MAVNQSASVSFTPGDNGTAIVTCIGQIKGTSGGDYGSAYYYRCFLTQSGVTTYGESYPCSSTRTPFSCHYGFSVVGGVSALAGLEIGCSGATSVEAFNVKVDVEVVKK